MLVFAVGSTNKAKVKAVEMALEKVFPKATRSVVAVKACPVQFSMPYDMIIFGRRGNRN